MTDDELPSLAQVRAYLTRTGWDEHEAAPGLWHRSEDSGDWFVEVPPEGDLRQGLVDLSIFEIRDLRDVVADVRRELPMAAGGRGGGWRGGRS